MTFVWNSNITSRKAHPAMTLVWNSHIMSWKAHSAVTLFWNSHIMSWKAHAAVTLIWNSHIMSWKAHAAVTLLWNSHIMSWKAHSAMTFVWNGVIGEDRLGAIAVVIGFGGRGVGVYIAGWEEVGPSVVRVHRRGVRHRCARVDGRRYRHCGAHVHQRG